MMEGYDLLIGFINERQLVELIVIKDLVIGAHFNFSFKQQAQLVNTTLGKRQQALSNKYNISAFMINLEVSQHLSTPYPDCKYGLPS